MHDLPDQFPSDTLEPGTHLLGLSLPMQGLARLSDLFIAHGLEVGDDCILITTDRGAGDVLQTIQELAADPVLERFVIVDATGQEYEGESPCQIESVGSPGDLTGIGIGLTKAIDALEPDPGEFRVTVDSVSSLLVHAGFDRVYQFMHMVVNRIGSRGGTGISLLAADTDASEVSQFEGLIDGVIDVRSGDDGGEYRVRGATGTGDWYPIDDTKSTQPTSDRSAAKAPTDDIDVEVPRSFSAFIESVNSRGLTLTICNPDTAIDDQFTDYFDRHNVGVRSADLTTETPRGAAILHRDAEPIAMSSIENLRAAITLESTESLQDPALKRPAVLRHVHRNEFSVANGSRIELTRISRLIEGRALETGRGALHTGFQRLQRIDDDIGTQAFYEAIGATDVIVHVYGASADIPDGAADVVHTAEDGELLDSWFVVYDGGGDPDKMAALVCEEIAPGEYSGVWSYKPADVIAVFEYLETTYGEQPVTAD
ncbi:DUF7504 family protein [Halococcoides cellulosivorans]|uniref:Histidine kinase n=1 Tax=Halococcoides cellulosivorans TaxID=1679096 RepID=A0A2R4X0T2_9EURY|nr:hypothetical protein [Halococcoides cellulosivorans]AWB27407.1 hypothetical protein HARCEL1_06675 [Halococcoides cellulosivorans]